MKKLLKNAVVAALSATLILTLAACGGGGGGTTTTNPPAPDTSAPAPADSGTGTTGTTERVQITYSFWGNEAEAAETQAAADLFNASQDRIEVSIMPIPWENYVENLTTMAMAGNLPDTGIMSEAGLIQWAEQGMLMDISNMYAPGEARPMDSLAYTYMGDPVAYAVANVFLVKYYNKDMFDAAGIPYPPSNPADAWDWDKFVEVAKQLTLDANGNTPNDAGFDSNNIVQYGAMVENLTWQLEVWALSNGAGFYNEDGTEVIIDDPRAIEAIQRVADLHLVHHVAPLSSGMTDDGVQRSLLAGTVAMTTNGTWNIGTALASARDDDGLNYGLAVLPYMKELVTINTGGSNVVFSQTNHPEEAMEWLKWYGNPENAWGLISAGIWNPTLASYFTEGPEMMEWLSNPAYPPLEESKPVLVDFYANYARPTSWFYTNNTNDFNQLLGNILGDVWIGRATAEEVITQNIDALRNAHAGW